MRQILQTAQGSRKRGAFKVGWWVKEEAVQKLLHLRFGTSWQYEESQRLWSGFKKY